jgi:hypothetical protein
MGKQTHQQIVTDMQSHANKIREVLSDGFQISDMSILLEITLACTKYVDNIKKLSGVEKKDLVRAVMVELCPDDNIDYIIDFLVMNCLRTTKNSINLRECASFFTCKKIK